MKWIICFLFVGKLWATELPLVDLNGGAFKTDKEQVFMLFWATWCSECKDKIKNELPSLAQNAKLQVVTVNIDTSVDRAKHFVRKHPFSFPVLRDETRDISSRLQVGPVPHWGIYRRVNDDWILIDHQVGFDLGRIKKKLIN